MVQFQSKFDLISMDTNDPEPRTQSGKKAKGWACRQGHGRDRGNLRGFRKDANYDVKEEDEKLLKYILEKGMERYDKRKNLWLAMERK